MSNDDFPLFFDRVPRVVENLRRRITKDCCSFAERDAMLASIRGVFLSVPLKVHWFSLWAVLGAAMVIVILPPCRER